MEFLEKYEEIFKNISKSRQIRFVSTLLSSLVNSLSDGHRCKSFLDNMSVKKCLNCNKNDNEDFNKDLINRFPSTY